MNRIEKFGLIAVILAFASANVWACSSEPSSERAVYIGDSHSVDGFGPHLQKMVERSNTFARAEVLRYAVSGSAADDWFPSDNSVLKHLSYDYYCSNDSELNQGAVPSAFPSFPQAVSGKTPKGVIIALGTNDMNSLCKSVPSEQVASVKRLLAEVPAGVPCFWVGPANFKEGDIFDKCGAQRIKAYEDNLRVTILASRKCSYIDSREFKAPSIVWGEDSLRESEIPKSPQDCRTADNQVVYPNSDDGTHFGGALAEFWADCAAVEINKVDGLFRVARQQRQLRRL